MAPLHVKVFRRDPTSCNRQNGLIRMAILEKMKKKENENEHEHEEVILADKRGIHQMHYCSSFEPAFLKFLESTS